MVQINSPFVGLLATICFTILLASVPALCDVQYAGYLGVYFQDESEQINLMLSNGNDALDFTPLNNGLPVLRSDSGMNHTRDPFLIRHPKEKKNYIIATDNSLKLQQNDPGASIRRSSRKITVYESMGDSLTEWKSSFSTPDLMPARSGGSSAPEAIWDEEKGKFLVIFSANLWPENDPDKKSEPAPASQIYSTYTYDFVTFEETKLYYSIEGGGLVDMTIAQLGPHCFVRFFRDDTNATLKVRGQRSDSGLWGTWTNIGSGKEYIADEANGGPLLFEDNRKKNLWRVWIDRFVGGYTPYETNQITEFGYNKSDAPHFLNNIKQGSVLPVTQAEYDVIKSKKWPSIGSPP